MRSSTIRLFSSLFSVFLPAFFLPGLSGSNPEEAPREKAGEKAGGKAAEKPEREGADKAKGAPAESFDDLYAQFEKEKDLEVYKRIATVEKFGNVPTKESVDFLTKLYD